MAATKYTYSISEDFPNHKVSSDRLTQEVDTSEIVTGLDYIETAGDVCDIWFKGSLSSGDETILDGLVAAHSGEPLDPGPDEVRLTDFPDMKGWYYWRKGYRWEMTAGETNSKDVKFDKDVRLIGGGFRLDGNVTDGDYIEFQIVDVDGIIYPPGTVLTTFISSEYLWANREFDVMQDDGALVYEGLYLRCKYVSLGSTNVIMKAWYHIRHIP